MISQFPSSIEKKKEQNKVELLVVSRGTQATRWDEYAIDCGL